jgi:hypothetical protein
MEGRLRALGAAVHGGPLRKASWLQPHAAEELAELLALGVVNAEAIAAEAALRRREGGEGQELCMPERKGPRPSRNQVSVESFKA